MTAAQMEEDQVYRLVDTGELIEFKYIGKTGKVIVCAPGERGAGMQSSFAVDAWAEVVKATL